MILDVEQRVRDANGYWSTFSPVFFMPGDDGRLVQATLPVPLAHNLTFAGYDPRVFQGERVPGGDPVVLVTYWRVDGPLPTGMGVFAHLLGYSQTEPPVPLLEPWAEANSMDVLPGELQNRDFFAQVSYIWLGEHLDSGRYALTAGAYTGEVANVDGHLPVLDADTGYQPHGDRLMLGDVTLVAPQDEQRASGNP
jgi:hypothetical protein